MIRHLTSICKGIVTCAIMLIAFESFAQHSVARQWNEQVLEAIRNDFARPTVHARNLFHSSVAMYDAWAAYEKDYPTWFLNGAKNNFNIDFYGVGYFQDKKAAQEEAISFACYRLIAHRFKNSPGWDEVEDNINSLMDSLGFDVNIASTLYTQDGPAALGNFIAQSIIEKGMEDGSNEGDSYKALYYKPVNPSLSPRLRGNRRIDDPNRWQAFSMSVFIDQAGNVFRGATTQFVGPEWGNVIPFALEEKDRSIYYRDSIPYNVYHDPGPPPMTNTADSIGKKSYQWGFGLVSKWASHLDTADQVYWDISPGNLGNIENYPTDQASLQSFYDTYDGCDPGNGHAFNPKTGKPYKENYVLRGDYTRVLAEFWADGPDSETPPGHWFTLLNYVSDHPSFEKRFKGEGEILDDLSWDVISYFCLGGAMHDAAISAWSTKGWYDYIRPISAIRYMASKGQSSDKNASNYHPEGIPLDPGFVETIQYGDELAGRRNQHVGKIKLYTWKGPSEVDDPKTDMAGVGWIRAENWMPYQRPTFVTPPFAGYVSGHSTYSRAAAEVLHKLTGDPYFPGGIGEFIAEKNEFLVFEEGPSEDVVLQWATYKDASDQTSLSRIWGGIHPPCDDLPGRLIGKKVGLNAFAAAEQFLQSKDQQSLGLNYYTSVSQFSKTTILDTLEIKVGLPQIPKKIEWILEDKNRNPVFLESPQMMGYMIRSKIVGLPKGKYYLTLNVDGEKITKIIRH